MAFQRRIQVLEPDGFLWIVAEHLVIYQRPAEAQTLRFLLLTPAG